MNSNLNNDTICCLICAKQNQDKACFEFNPSDSVLRAAKNCGSALLTGITQQALANLDKTLKLFCWHKLAQLGGFISSSDCLLV
jgi:hypothetical protein